jgi:ketosteroid isomerase-like protein
METTTRAADGRSVLEGLFAAQEAGDIDAMRRYVHDDIVMEWPQSGERFRGIENAVGALTATEVKPELAGEPRIAGDGGHWVAMMPLRYGTEVFHYVGVYEVDDGRIRRSTEYFGAPFPAQEGRARFAER